MRIMGLDLSITCTGVCFPDESTAAIKPRGTGDTRLLYVEERMVLALRSGRPDLAVIEDDPGIFHGSAAKAIPMVHAVVRLTLMRAGIPYVLVNQTTLKMYATGYGRADKDSMALAALTRGGRRFPGDKGGDQCDAWWLRAAGHAAYGKPVVMMPPAHTDALRLVEWPRVGTSEPVMELRRRPATSRPRRRRKSAA